MTNIVHINNSHARMFCEAMIDLFRHTRSNHMSPYLYDDHAAVADDEPISGALMWRYAATREPEYYIARSDIQCLQQIIGDIADMVPHGLPLIDLGPGSIEAVENKSLKLLRALESTIYQPIDVSEKFTRDSEEFISSHASSAVSIGRVADFLAPNTRHDFDSEVITYYGGATISNLICPSTNDFPYEVLTTELEKLSKLIKNGWVIISYDGVQDEQDVLEAYRTKYFGRFIRNILYRAVQELPMINFDPDGFSYEPEWISSAHLLANIVVATKDQNFSIGSEYFQIRKGEKFNVLNSYKFTKQIFEGCCEQAGFEVIRSWDFMETPMKFYLLKCNFVAEAKATERSSGLWQFA